MKIIKDWMNGGTWQWKYYDTRLRLWFDYGPPFKDRKKAGQWMDEGGIHV